MRGGPRPPFQPRQNQSSDAILLLGDESHHNLNGASAGQKDAPSVAARQNGGSSIKINLSPSEAGKKGEAPKESKATVCSAQTSVILVAVCTADLIAHACNVMRMA